MKNWKFLLSFLAALTAAPLAQAQDSPLDYKKINSVIAALLAPMVAENPALAEVKFIIHEDETNFEQDRFGFTLSTTLKKSAWSASPTVFATSLKLRALVDYENGPNYPVSLNAKINVNLKTDTLAMMRFSAKTAKTMAGCPSRANSEASNALICAQLTALEGVQSLEQVADLVDGVLALLRAHANARIIELHAELNLPDSEVTSERREEARKEMDRYTNQLNILAQILVYRDAGQDGALKGVRIECGTVNLNDGHRLGNVAVNLQKDSFTLQGEIYLHHISDEAAFKETKTTALDMLRRAQAEDEAALVQIREFAGMYVTMVLGLTNPDSQ